MKKKSLVGWTTKHWGLFRIEHPCMQDVRVVRNDEIYANKSDCMDFSGVEPSAIKVRITIEEI